MGEPRDKNVIGKKKRAFFGSTISIRAIQVRGIATKRETDAKNRIEAHDEVAQPNHCSIFGDRHMSGFSSEYSRFARNETAYTSITEVETRYLRLGPQLVSPSFNNDSIIFKSHTNDTR